MIVFDFHRHGAKQRAKHGDEEEPRQDPADELHPLGRVHGDTFVSSALSLR